MGRCITVVTAMSENLNNVYGIVISNMNTENDRFSSNRTLI